MSELVRQSGGGMLENTAPIGDVLAQVRMIQELMRQVFKENEHFGKIPGIRSDKPSLFKSGAEKICMMFRLAPSYKIRVEDLPNNHRTYEVVCSLHHIRTTEFWGEGVGVCSTMESKYRYRTGPVEYTGKPVPREYWDQRKTDPAKAQASIGGSGYVVKKNDSGVWEIARQGEKVENDSIHDQYNTALKMAKKRALVDAVLTATSASDFFTQDLEDMVQKDSSEQEEKTVETTASTTDPPVLDSQIKYFYLLTKKANITEDDKHEWVGGVLGKTVTSINDLTKREMQKVLDTLEAKIKRGSSQ